MGVLTPSKNERLLLQRMFEEKCRMIGVEGFYHEVRDLNLDNTSNFDEIKYFDPVPISFLFEDMPNPRTLRNLHWWDDSDDSVPPIAYLPWHVNQGNVYELKPTVGSLIELPDPLGGDSRFYEVTEVNANTLYLVYSIVKLAPSRKDVRDHSRQFENKAMSVKDAPTDATDQVSPASNDYQYIHVPEPKEKPRRPASGYSFLNIDGRNRG